MDDDFKKLIYTAIIMIFFIVMIFRNNLMEYHSPVLTKMLIFMLAVTIGAVYLNYRKNNKKTKLVKTTTAEFEEIYKKLYNENISILENKRNSVKYNSFLQSITLFMAIIGIFVQSMLLMLAGLIFFILLGKNNKKEKDYKITYKKNIISSFIKAISNKLEYSAEVWDLQKIKEEYKEANFNNESFNEFYADDYIQGQLDDKYYTQMSDLNVQRKEVYYHKGQRRETTIEIFKGIFAKTECDKDIGTYIKISKNQLKLFRNKNRVEMDSQEFEKYFDIYSENKILTMRILTSDVMATLIDFYNKYHIEYEIVIRNNKIYMRFFTGAMFEPKIFGNSMDKKLLFSYYCILKFIVDVTKEVNKALKEVEI